jgi:hypothetical protein
MRFVKKNLPRVWFSPYVRPQKTVAVKKKIELILSRVDAVEGLLGSPIGDKGEERRRNDFLRSFHHLLIGVSIELGLGNSSRSRII